MLLYRILAVLCLVLLVVQVEVKAQSDIPTPILKKLKAQTEAWNRADIKGFMSAYWESPQLRFIGKSGIKYGWENVLLNYQKNYKDASEMGFLTFTLLDTEALSKESHLIIGKWHLKRANDELEGFFTLVWKKIKGEWVIVADHSS